MSLTFEGGRKTTREDSRMLDFFDALVQRDISGISDEDSDNFYESSYTNTVYTSPETSSSDNDGKWLINYQLIIQVSKYTSSISRPSVSFNFENALQMMTQTLQIIEVCFQQSLLIIRSEIE